MAEKIKAFMNAVKVWNREVFGNIQEGRIEFLDVFMAFSVF